MEILLAAFLPPAFVAAIAQRRAADTRRAFRIFAFLTLAWLSPCWLTLSTNAPLDYLLDDPPFTRLRTDGSLTKNFLLNDVVTQILPLREAARRSLASGHLPLFDRYAAAGTPLWENVQVALLYPINLVALPFSRFAWPLFSSSAKLLLALCGMYLFLRRLGASDAGSLFGAIAWAFCTFQIAFLLFPVTNVTVLLPLLLLTIDDVIAGGAPHSIAAATLVTWMILVGGHPESILHSALIAVPFAIFRWWPRRSGPSLARLAACAIVAALLAAPVLVPFLAYAPHTERAATLARSRSIVQTSTFAAENFLPILIPNYFGNPRVHNYRHPLNFNELCTDYAGLTTLILALGAIRRRNLFWIVILVLAATLAFLPAPLIPVINRIPLLNIAANGRMRFAIDFCLAVLAAMELERPRRAIAAAVAVLVAVIAIVSYPTFAAFGVRRLIFFTEIFALAGAAAIVLRKQRLLPALLFLDLASVMLLFNPANPRSIDYPTLPAIDAMRSAGDGPFRVAGIRRSLVPNVAAIYGLEDIRPHDPMAFAPYVEMLTAAGLNTTDYFNEFTTMPSPSLLRFLGVRKVIDGERVVTLDDARPRYFSEAARVDIVRYSPNGATLRVTAPAAARIESSEPALPGWQLTRGEVLWPRNSDSGAFLSWNAPAGMSTFELEYVPVGLAPSVAAAAAGAIALAIWIITAARKTPSRPHEHASAPMRA